MTSPWRVNVSNCSGPGKCETFKVTQMYFRFSPLVISATCPLQGKEGRNFENKFNGLLFGAILIEELYSELVAAAAAGLRMNEARECPLFGTLSSLSIC